MMKAWRTAYALRHGWSQAIKLRGIEVSLQMEAGFLEPYRVYAIRDTLDDDCLLLFRKHDSLWDARKRYLIAIWRVWRKRICL